MAVEGKSDSQRARQRGASPAAKVKADTASREKAGTPSTAQKPATDGAGATAMAGWISLLVATQMVMLIYTNRCTKRARLPLLLCVAQFVTSAALAGMASLARAGCIPVMPRTLWQVIVPLSAVWTAGFVLFNASASYMSPALVSLVRCMEPLATVCVGLALGERYSWRVLSTLVPICGGVVLAAGKGGVLSTVGICLAMLSNLSFCGRPFFTQRLKQHPDHRLDDLGVFFNVTCVAVMILPPWLLLLEGREVVPALQRLLALGELWQFAADMLCSSLFFFLYQFIQLMVMSKLSPLAFSVLTPVIKAFMIVACSLYFGDPFGFLSAVGVLTSTGGGYLFTLARSSDGKKMKPKDQQATKEEKKL